jgi:GNAT superfamily N-acetyltransferase
MLTSAHDTTMKSIRREFRRAPEFLRWRRPLLVLLLAVRELLRPLAYWYVFDIFATDLRLPLPASYSTESLVVRFLTGDQDVQQAVTDLAGLDGLASNDIELRLVRGDVVAVAYACDDVAGYMWLTFSTGMELAFGTSWRLESSEALRYDSFVRPEWRGRAIHSLLNNSLNSYAREHGILRTLAGISILNSQSSSLAKHFRKARAMRVMIFRVRGLNWTYRRAIGVPLQSRFDLTSGFRVRLLPNLQKKTAS